MDAAQALADLTEISSQIESAVVTDAEGAVLASTFAEADRADALAGAAEALLTAADRVQGESGSPLAQLEAATPEGSVFLVRDAGRLIAATTRPEPTVGLVFYDLKSCLRAIAAETEDEAKPRPKARRTKEQPEEAPEDDAA
jgi:predicted regulator of Ras-like GTPase activity (Roadblock/LC7/MglB family)